MKSIIILFSIVLLASCSEQKNKSRKIDETKLLEFSRELAGSWHFYMKNNTELKGKDKPICIEFYIECLDTIIDTKKFITRPINEIIIYHSFPSIFDFDCEKPSAEFLKTLLPETKEGFAKIAYKNNSIGILYFDDPSKNFVPITKLSQNTLLLKNGQEYIRYK